MKEIEKQAIEEMAKVIEGTEKVAMGSVGVLPSPTMYAKELYWKGYRKQRAGEWISVEGDVIFKCSICDAEISTSWDYENDDMFAYCPCCGANMKGGAE